MHRYMIGLNLKILKKIENKIHDGQKFAAIPYISFNKFSRASKIALKLILKPV